MERERGSSRSRTVPRFSSRASISRPQGRRWPAGSTRMPAFWSWEPVQVLSMLAWLVYAVLLQARSLGWRGRRAATLTLAGFALLLVTLLSLNLGLPHGRAIG